MGAAKPSRSVGPRLDSYAQIADGRRPMIAARKHLLLIGGGHAHVAVLADWIKRGLPCPRVTLVTPSQTLRYSGMVPGWIAGQYARDVGVVDVGALAQRAGAALVLDKCAAIEPDPGQIVTEGGETIAFDIASIDTGGIGRASAILGEDNRLIDIRPIDAFVSTLARSPVTGRVAIVGGGAGGTELAFALRNRTRGTERAEVVLVTGSDGLLPKFAPSVRKMVANELNRQEIAVITQDAQFADGQFVVGGASVEPFDLIIAALGSGAPQWPQAGGLACDQDGFIAVDAQQKSISHPNIFAVGDVAARQDRAIPHSGVHAVFAGPVLAANLRAVMAGEEPKRSYRPRWNNLYLMSSGDGSAIASYGPFAARGAWVAKLKHWIDNRWIAKYAALAEGTDQGL